MPADARPEILIVSVDGELPAWFSKKEVFDGYHWSAYLKPLPGGLLGVALKHAERTKGVLLVDTGHLEKRLAHCEDGVLPSWFERNFLWRIAGESREQCFPLVILYDSERDQDLPNELKLHDLHCFWCLSRNHQLWTSHSDLADCINHVWNDWLKKEKLDWTLVIEEKAAVLETTRQIQDEIQVVIYYDKFDNKCWEAIAKYIGTPHNKRFCLIDCHPYRSRSPNEAKKSIIECKDVVLMLSPGVTESEIWSHILPILLEKVRRGDGAKIRWFMTQITEIPEELINCDILHPSVLTQDRLSDGMRKYALINFDGKPRLKEIFKDIGHSLYEKCCKKISIKE